MLENTKLWFEDEGHSANITTIDEKIRELTIQNVEISSRIERQRRLTKAVSSFERDLNTIIKQGESIRDTKTWSEDYYNKNFSIAVGEIKSWYSEIKAKQDKLSFIEVGVFTYCRNQF